MANQKDVFGFDELEKAFDRVKEKYVDEADALLQSLATQTNKRLRQLAPTGVGSKNPGTLKKSYRAKKPKNYKSGKVKVARVENIAAHGHLYELGHEIYTAKRKSGKVQQYNALGRRIKGITHHGRVKGRYLFDKALSELRTKLPKETEKILKKVTKDVEV